MKLSEETVGVFKFTLMLEYGRKELPVIILSEELGMDRYSTSSYDPGHFSFRKFSFKNTGKLFRVHKRDDTIQLNLTSVSKFREVFRKEMKIFIEELLKSDVVRQIDYGRNL